MDPRNHSNNLSLQIRKLRLRKGVKNNGHICLNNTALQVNILQAVKFFYGHKRKPAANRRGYSLKMPM